jgi:hypothetical protein
MAFHNPVEHCITGSKRQNIEEDFKQDCLKHEQSFSTSRSTIISYKQTHHRHPTQLVTATTRISTRTKFAVATRLLFQTWVEEQRPTRKKLN